MANSPVDAYLGLGCRGLLDARVDLPHGPRELNEALHTAHSCLLLLFPSSPFTPFLGFCKIPRAMAARQLLFNLQRQIPRAGRQAPPIHTNAQLSRTFQRPWCRFQSNSGKAGSDAASRASRIIARLPPPLRRYASRLRDAPVLHVASFLTLHEITAVVPLLGLFGLFHYTDLVPIEYITGRYGAYVGEGLRKFEKYFKRKGWFGFKKGDAEGEDGGPNSGEGALARWKFGGKYKMVVEVALAYAITKVLLPVRIMVSLWATPWFAGVLGRLGLMVTRKRPPL